MNLNNIIDKTDAAVEQFKNSDSLGLWLSDKIHVISWYWDNFTLGFAVILVFGFCAGIGFMLLWAYFKKLTAKVERAERLLQQMEDQNESGNKVEGDSFCGSGNGISHDDNLG